MFNKVKECLSEIIDIADECPEKYQVKCFEVLLSALVRPEPPPVGAVGGVQATGIETPVTPKADFFSRHGIAGEEWTRVFAFDEGSCSIIVTELKAKAKKKKQIKLALLLGVQGLLETGESSISKKSLTELCKYHNAFDRSNFARHMKEAGNLLRPKGDGWVLTAPGETEAAEIIRELAQ